MKPPAYEKAIGPIFVYASEPFPRFVSIDYGGEQTIRNMTLSEVRDLQYMLSQVLELAAKDED